MNLNHYALLNKHRLYGDEPLRHPKTNQVKTALEWSRIYSTKQCREFNLFNRANFSELIQVDLNTATIHQFNGTYFHQPLKNNDTNRQEAIAANQI